MAGYKGFGSFHSDNVEELLRIPGGPTLPPFPAEVRDKLAALEDSKAATTSADFGAPFRKLFYLEDDWTFINHGAFGAAAKPVLEVAEAWRRAAERQPLRFIDRELFPYLVGVMRELAAFVGTAPTSLVLVPNATTGLNAVIKSVPLAAGDKVFLLNIAYGSVKTMLKVAAAKAGATVVEAEVPLPIKSSDAVLDIVREQLPEGAKLAVFDHITSNTAVVLPVKELVAIAHARGVPVLIDGAHALGMLDLNVDDIGAEFYVSNAHKWLCCPKGAGLLAVQPKWQAVIEPPILSHGYGAGFASGFIWDGCRDYSTALSIPAALKWWQRVDIVAARAYSRDLLAQAVALLTAAWGTDTVAPLDMFGQMALVRLPESVIPTVAGESKPTSTHSKILQDRLHYTHSIEVPIKCLSNVLYVRISCAPYNSLSEYQLLADTVLSWAAAP